MPARRLVECVPNFSEGRDAAIVSALVDAVRSVPDVVMLDQELDGDHNRSVLTFAGPPEAVSEAALRAVGKAVELIDLNRHTGVHPRIGAADVVPFVPIEGVTLEECVQLAERTGQEIWRRYQVPVYFYEAAARRPDRVNLENIRRGQFEGLREEVATNPERAPDIGGPLLHPTAGAVVVGARKFLIAYNINLNTPDIDIAKRIAKAIRFSSGGFRYVKAMGVPLTSRNLAQVSMNLTDFEQTPVHRVFEAVRTEAERYGASIAGSEIVGLIPRRAIEMAAEFYLRCENFRPEIVLENRIEQAARSGVEQSGDTRGGLNDFLDSLGAATPAPGGGSASAAAGAMAAALGAMVSSLARRDRQVFDDARRWLADAVDRDAAVFHGVMAAYRMPKTERAPYVEEALHQAALVPMEVAESVCQLDAELAALEREAPARFSSDLQTARALAAAALAGALANVRINLESIGDQAFRGSLDERIRRVSR
jgi:glutamate formiminotransferase / formiminotetrahydrofolate cyclodeaminase